VSVYDSDSDDGEYDDIEGFEYEVCSVLPEVFFEVSCPEEFFVFIIVGFYMRKFVVDFIILEYFEF